MGQTVKLWDARPLTPELRTIREAVELVEFLFGQHLTTSDVLDRVRDNPSLSRGPQPVPRSGGVHGERLLDQQAEPWSMVCTTGCCCGRRSWRVFAATARSASRCAGVP